MNQIPVPPEIARRAWERAWVLTQEYTDRLTLEQLVRMHVIRMVDPERLGWSEVGEVISLDAIMKIRSKAK